MDYIYTKNEFLNVLDGNITFIMDTNVWLDLYSLSPSTIESIVRCLGDKIDLFWLPNQVYIEFNRHMVKSRDEALNRYKNLKTSTCQILSDAVNGIDSEFNKLKHRGITDAQPLHKAVISDIKETINKIKQDLDNLIKDYSIEVQCISKESDVVSNLINNLRKRSNTSGFKIFELLLIYEEGEKRFKYNVPPGYTDANKKEKQKIETAEQFLLRKYGDLILWKEILHKVSGKKENLVFIQNERKSDWWDKKPNNNKNMPKVLTEEFESHTLKGSKLYMIDFEEFLYHFGERFNLPANSVEEITSKLKFEKSIYEYLENNMDLIVETYIAEYFEDNYCDNPINEHLVDISVFGGSVDSVDDLTIDRTIINSSEFILEKDLNITYITANLEIECQAHINEYVNNYVSHSGYIKATIRFILYLYFSIDVSNTNIEFKKAYEIEQKEIDDIEIIDIKAGEFSVDVDVDEDLFRDR